MNEEEKKAIDELNSFINIPSYVFLKEYELLMQSTRIALNLIEKLQKENEELNLKYYMLYTGKIEMIKARELKIPNSVVSKQKIKDKIEKEIKYHEKNILDIENITLLNNRTAKEEAEIQFNKYAIVVLKMMLQKLLEGRK